MVYQINYDDPKIHLDELIIAALRGDKVIIVGKEGKQMVVLVPVKHGQRRKFGSAKGKIKFSKDFNSPLADFNAYMLRTFCWTRMCFFGSLQAATN